MATIVIKVSGIVANCRIHGEDGRCICRGRPGWQNELGLYQSR